MIHNAAIQAPSISRNRYNAIDRAEQRQAPVDGVQNLAGRPILPPVHVVQVNVFLLKIANGGRKIDYLALQNAAPRSQEESLYKAIAFAISQNQRRQAILQVLADEGWDEEIVETVKVHWRHSDEGALAAYNLHIRSSHSGGAIDPQLPQPAYEAPPVLGISVEPPARNNIRHQANWMYLAASTTVHTTDPDSAQFREAAPFLGGANRLSPAPNRVASYFEFSADTIHHDGQVVVSGTRLVYDPFNHQYFLSEHYACQFELTNIPPVTSELAYQKLQNCIRTLTSLPDYLMGTEEQQVQLRISTIKELLDKKF